MPHATTEPFDNPDLIVACRQRRRGGDWTAGNELAFQQLLTSHRRGGFADLHLNSFKIATHAFSPTSAAGGAGSPIPRLWHA
jgi:hypothetical protein